MTYDFFMMKRNSPEFPPATHHTCVCSHVHTHASAEDKTCPRLGSAIWAIHSWPFSSFRLLVWSLDEA